MTEFIREGSPNCLTRAIWSMSRPAQRVLLHSDAYNGGFEGYLAQKEAPSPPGPPCGPRHRPAVEYEVVAASYDPGAVGSQDKVDFIARNS